MPMCNTTRVITLNHSSGLADSGKPLPRNRQEGSASGQGQGCGHEAAIALEGCPESCLPGGEPELGRLFLVPKCELKSLLFSVKSVLLLFLLKLAESPLLSIG